MNTKHGLALLTAILLAGGIYVVQASAIHALPRASDLQADAERGGARGKPVLIFFMSETCPYCELVADLYLKPMYERGDYKDKVLFRVIDVSGNDRLIDFSGKTTSHESFADRQGATLTPAIKLYGPKGILLVPAVVGYSSPDFYLGFLEESIDAAIARLKNNR